MQEETVIRLDKLLCEMGAGSRSEVKAMLKKGRVTVDGIPVLAGDRKVEEHTVSVCLDGQPMTYAKTAYYLLHKPAGVVTAVRDKTEKTVMDLMQGAAGKDLFPVGRLDKDTEGLLLITNDGALSHRLLSPKKHVDKTYLVLTRDAVTTQMCRRLEAGVGIGDENPTLPARVRKLPDREDGILLTIVEGRFHQVKRMLQAVGNEVVYLKRISMGPLTLGDLPAGCFRPLTEEEKKALGVEG